MLISSHGSKQTGAPGLNAQATVGHLGRARQPGSPLLSGRAALGHLGVGRRYTDTTGLLHTRRIQLPALPDPNFARLHTDAQRLQQRLAAHDSLHAATPAAAPRPTPFHAPLMTPALQSRIRQEHQQRKRTEYAQRLLAEYNQTKQATYLPRVLRELQLISQLNLLNELGAAPAGHPASTGPDLFMPKSF